MSEFELDRYSLDALTRRTGAKWARDGDGAIAAWIADMDYPIAPAIRSVLLEAIQTDDLGYPSTSTIEAVAVAFAQRAATRHGLVIEPALTRVLADVVQAIALCLVALTEPGDGVLFFTPSYPPFFEVAAQTNRRSITSDLFARPGDRYEIDFVGLDRLLSEERPRVLLLCNPHNPTGRAFSRVELEQLGERCLHHNLIVISDEIHADLVLPGAMHFPIAKVDERLAKRTVTLGSASKAFNIAGLRCAVAAFGGEELSARAATVPLRLLGGASVTGMLAAIAAWEHGDSWLEAVLERLDANRSLLRDRLAEIQGVKFQPPEATYLAWLDLRATGLGDDPASSLRSSARIALSPGSDFGTSGNGHARLNFATTQPVLEELLDRLTGAIA